MDIAVWIVSGILALAYLGAGFMKAATPREKLAERMGWVEGFTPLQVKLIGVVEILGAIGLIVPVLTGILPILTPIAATGLVIVQVVALIVHLRRGEVKEIAPNIVFLLLALFVAIVRFGLI